MKVSKKVQSIINSIESGNLITAKDLNILLKRHPFVHWYLVESKNVLLYRIEL